jgi:hypothetical protein
MVKNKKRILVIATLLFEVNGICFAQGNDLFKDSNRASTNVQNAQFPRITPDLRGIRRQCVAIAGHAEYKCIPLSLKTNRFFGIHPRTGDPFSADRPGVLHGCRDGTVLSWKVLENNKNFRSRELLIY